MKNSIEIRQERATAIENANTLLSLAKDESRDFTADEQVSYDGMMTNIDKLAKDIEVVERREKLNAEAASIPVSHATQNVSDSKELRGFSFVEAFNPSILSSMSLLYSSRSVLCSFIIIFVPSFLNTLLTACSFFFIIKHLSFYWSFWFYCLNNIIL